MIDRVVRYLSDAGVPFRVSSYPSPEPEPAVAHRLSPGTQLVDAHVVLVDGSPALVCTTHAVPLNLGAFATETGTTAIEATSAELRDEFRNAPEPLPALGGIFGVPLFLDEQVLGAGRIAFCAFAPSDYVEMAYDDYARLERPRVVALARGALPQYARSSSTAEAHR